MESKCRVSVNRGQSCFVSSSDWTLTGQQWGIKSAMFSHMIMLIFAQIDAAPAYDVKPIVIRYHGNGDKSCCLCFALDTECAAAVENHAIQI